MKFRVEASMRHLLTAAILISTLPAMPGDLVLKNTQAQVYFSPHGGAQEAIVATIAQAKKTIRCQAYSFTSAPIAEALKRAHDRGVDVRVCLDRSQRTEHYSGASFLQRAGITVWIDASHAIAHSKVMVLDGVTVITGSFNFTKAAQEKNLENVLIIQDAGLAKLYSTNWEEHRQHSEPYQPR